MRRRNAISVRVRNPSRGLVTRLPSEEADEFRPGDLRRTFLDAQNVRFEDGVVAAAPGYSKVRLVTPLLEDLVSHWRMEEPMGSVRADLHGDNDFTPFDDSIHDASVLQVEGLIDKAVEVSHDAIMTTDIEMPTGEFTWSGWFKFSSIVGAHQILGCDSFVLKRNGNSIRLTTSADGITQETTLDSSATITTGTWVFIAFRWDGSTLTLDVDGTLDTATPTDIFDGTVTLTLGGGLGSNILDVDSLSFWTRDLTDDELDEIQNNTDGLDYPFLPGAITLIQQGNIIDDSTPKPLTMAAGGNLYSVSRTYNEEFIATLSLIYEGTPPADLAFGWSAVDFYDKQVYAQRDNVPQYWKPALSATQDVPGLPEKNWDGCESFFGHLLLWKDDVLKWSALNDIALWLPVSQTAASFVMTIDTPGFTQPSAGGSVTIPTVENPNSEGVVDGQFIRIDDVQSGLTYTNYYQITSHTGSSITATLLDLTGVTTAGLTVAAGEDIFSVDANDSGETQNVGAHVNGPIFQILSQGDYAYIFKERSIQSIQYVGLGSGVFFIHPEISNEGLLSRSSLVGLGDGRMIFVGHREIYQYIGGPTLQPIVQQFSRQMYAEMDRSRLDRILLFHKEFKNEVWIQYPVIGGMKVLIWNYREDTASIDIWPTERDGISAIAEVEWPVDTSWAVLADSVTWDNFDQHTSWAEVTANGADRFTLTATGDNELVIHGTGFNRNGEAYTALAETQDWDGDEPDIFKYVDVVIVGLQVKLPDTVTRRVWVQLGYRDWLDDDVKWTTPMAIKVQGNYSPPPIRLNPGGAGRFLRLRFYSNEVDVPWRITSYEIHSRPGSYY